MHIQLTLLSRWNFVPQVEDIVDTGLTGETLVRHFKQLGAASVEMCTLLSKPSRRKVVGFEARYVGFEIPDRFVVGMGLDFDEQYRTLGYIGVYRDRAE